MGLKAESMTTFFHRVRQMAALGDKVVVYTIAGLFTDVAGSSPVVASRRVLCRKFSDF